VHREKIDEGNVGFLLAMVMKMVKKRGYFEQLLYRRDVKNHDRYQEICVQPLHMDKSKQKPKRKKFYGEIG